MIEVQNLDRKLQCIVLLEFYGTILYLFYDYLVWRKQRNSNSGYIETLSTALILFLEFSPTYSAVKST